MKGVDGVIFVADSQIERMEANVESIENLRTNLAEQGYSLEKLPFVIQYNKRDLPNVAATDELRQMLNKTNVPDFEAVARTGVGVFDTLKAGEARADRAEEGRRLARPPRASNAGTAADRGPATPAWAGLSYPYAVVDALAAAPCPSP